jgi:hypothetical protein
VAVAQFLLSKAANYNDIGRPRAWRWAKIRRMENLPFHQTNRTPHHGQSRGQQTLRGGGDEMERC